MPYALWYCHMAQENNNRYNRLMDCAKILAALDEEIDRFQRARNLLAGVLPSRKPSKPAAVAPKEEAPLTKWEATVPLQSRQVAPQIQKLPYREKGRTRRSRRPPFTSIASTALSCHSPATPVVVSASEAQRARVRETEQIRSMQIASPIEERSSGRSLGALIRALKV